MCCFESESLIFEHASERVIASCYMCLATRDQRKGGISDRLIEGYLFPLNGLDIALSNYSLTKKVLLVFVVLLLIFFFSLWTVN